MIRDTISLLACAVVWALLTEPANAGPTNIVEFIAAFPRTYAEIKEGAIPVGVDDEAYHDLKVVPRTVNVMRAWSSHNPQRSSFESFTETRFGTASVVRVHIQSFDIGSSEVWEIKELRDAFARTTDIRIPDAVIVLEWRSGDGYTTHIWTLDFSSPDAGLRVRYQRNEPMG